MKKYNILAIALAVICVIILVPLGIAFLLSFSFIYTDTSNEWIGFWGGYLGAIIGGLSTLIVFKYTISYNNKLYDKDKRFVICKELIKLSSTYNFQVTCVIKASYKYVQNFNREDYVEFIHACNMVGNAAEELNLYMLVYGKRYPQVKKIVDGYDEIQREYLLFAEDVKSGKINALKDDKDKLMKFYNDKSNKIFDKIEGFNNMISTILTEFI